MPLDYYVAAFGDEMLTVATMDVGHMWDRMLGEYLQEWTRINRQSIPAAEVEKHMLAFMENLSDNPEIDLARKSAGVSYNQGRNAEVKSAGETGAAEYVVRSEILDENTCGACMMLDGLIMEIDSPDFDEYAPPAKCEGGDRCRGFYVAIPAEMAA